ncbi:GNAT family N-acetyltransferase [Alkalicoccus halolimnae]|uniref:GNAT family N-acetyltransferase n=1 Tax=Alkalicoccus halolimnae TaxID=1667239 RepID=A0A5C7FCJ8_9BACI|nr:GNAT family N-acetyltransferase [Alkalicoccus halolimnae]TXF87198.1 GNAT family N-acetyltransferase [Alkalicoccus halolimnae]
MYSAFLEEPKTNKDKETLVHEYEDFEFQILRMQDNIKKIAKDFRILGIDRTNSDEWLVIYSKDDGCFCKVMAHSCNKPFQGHWEFSIHATYKNDEIFIDDIRGEADRGYGSVCMRHLQEYAGEQNVPVVTGVISERDWNHNDRLKHFYEKHNFQVQLDSATKTGYIFWENQ